MRAPLVRTLVLSCAATAVFALAFGTGIEARAQGQPPRTGSHTEMGDRDLNATMIEHNKDEAAGRSAASKQMNEDFLSIQTVDADMLKTFSAANPPDFKKISDDAAEIKLRAKRLKDYLVLPPGAKEEKRKDAFGGEDLKSYMPILRDSIKSFVGNPIFQQVPGEPVDYREVGKARSDLADIIDLSTKVQKAAEKLKK